MLNLVLLPSPSLLWHNSVYNLHRGEHTVDLQLVVVYDAVAWHCCDADGYEMTLAQTQLVMQQQPTKDREQTLVAVG